MWNHSGVFATFLCIFVALAQCNVVKLPDDVFQNLTSARVEIYVQHHERQTAANTKALEDTLADFHQTFTAQLNVINLQGAMVEEKLHQTDNRLNPMEMFSEVHTHCVQQHRQRLPIYNTLKVTLAACIARGTTGYPALVATPTATLTNLKSYYINTHNKALSECKRLNPKADKKYADCMMKTVNITMDVTHQNTHNFKRQMEASTCAAQSKIKEVFDCYAQIVFGVFSTIGQVNGLVDDCIGQYDLCPTCVGELGESVLTAFTGRCPFQMSWHLADDDLKKSEIKNPFQGINNQAPCLQINFIRNGGVLLQ